MPHPYKEILLSDTTEQTRDACNSLGKLQQYSFE